MKKLILLALVAFMAVSVSAQVKRFTPQARFNYYNKVYPGITSEQKTAIIKIFADIDAKEIADDKEYQRVIKAGQLSVQDVLTDDQKANKKQ